MTQQNNAPQQHNLSDYEVSILLIERDACQYRAERIDELLNQVGKTKGIENTNKDSHSGTKNQRIAISEDFFAALKFEPHQGAKIGQYEVAYKPNNDAEKWDSIHQVLQQANAKIDNRYHGQGYIYSYWLYGTNKVYRQKLKPKA